MLRLNDNAKVIFNYQGAINGATASEVEFLKEEQQELEKVIINSDLDEESKQAILDITNNYYDRKKDNVEVDWVVEEDLNLTISDLEDLVSENVVISGSIGTWDGRYELVSGVEDLTLRQAIKKIISDDYYNFVIVREDNDLKIYCIHHDNYNEFLIKREDGNSIFKKGDGFYEKTSDEVKTENN